MIPSVWALARASAIERLPGDCARRDRPEAWLPDSRRVETKSNPTTFFMKSLPSATSVLHQLIGAFSDCRIETSVGFLIPEEESLQASSDKAGAIGLGDD
jgi:hypothetical protein